MTTATIDPERQTLGEVEVIGQDRLVDIIAHMLLVSHAVRGRRALARLQKSCAYRDPSAVRGPELRNPW